MRAMLLGRLSTDACLLPNAGLFVVLPFGFGAPRRLRRARLRLSLSTEVPRPLFSAVARFPRFFRLPVASIVGAPLPKAKISSAGHHGDIKWPRTDTYPPEPQNFDHAQKIHSSILYDRYMTIFHDVCGSHAPNTPGS